MHGQNHIKQLQKFDTVQNT